VITPDQLKDPNILTMLSANANAPDTVNVLLYERPTGPFDSPKFYYFVTRQDLLGDNGNLDNPIATFDNPNDLVKFLTSAQNYGDYMVITDGKTFTVYPRSLYEIPASQLSNPVLLTMLRMFASNFVNVLLPVKYPDMPRPSWARSERWRG